MERRKLTPKTHTLTPTHAHSQKYPYTEMLAQRSKSCFEGKLEKEREKESEKESERERE